MIVTGLRTGMRMGELRALEWDDVEWGDRKIQVRRVAARGQIGSTKNHREQELPGADPAALSVSPGGSTRSGLIPWALFGH